MNSRMQVVFSGSVVTISTAIATWWLVGDLSYGPEPSPYLQVSLPEYVYTLAGTISLTIIGVALWLFIKKGKKEQGFAGWLATLVLLCVAASGTAYLGRVVSANNQGGDHLKEAMALFFGLPAIALLIAAAVIVFAVTMKSRSRT